MTELRRRDTCRCAPEAERRGDQRFGTAAPAPRWLLVEQPGPWGRIALTQSRLDPAVAAAIAERAAVAGVRVALIRRPGRTAPGGSRRWAYVDSRPGREAIWWGSFDADAELLPVALDGTAGVRSSAPTYLVCTHGKHDVCCAIRGRATAMALAALRPDTTWECSHVGGDRFAANLVVLPHGLYYAHVTPDRAAELAVAYEAGAVDPTALRGRSSLSAPVQAAQHYAHDALHEYGVDALRPIEVEQLDPHTWRVLFAVRSGSVGVTVSSGRTTIPARLTCASTVLETTRVFRLVGLDVEGRPPSRDTVSRGGAS